MRKDNQEQVGVTGEAHKRETHYIFGEHVVYLWMDGLVDGGWVISDIIYF